MFYLGVPAHDLIVNGDFETGNLAPWEVQGTALQAGLGTYNVTSAGDSLCYGASPTDAAAFG